MREQSLPTACASFGDGDTLEINSCGVEEASLHDPSKGLPRTTPLDAKASHALDICNNTASFISSLVFVILREFDRLPRERIQIKVYWQKNKYNIESLRS